MNIRDFLRWPVSEVHRLAFESSAPKGVDVKRLAVKLAWFLFYPLLVLAGALIILGVALLAWPLVWTEFDAFERSWKERHNDPTDS